MRAQGGAEKWLPATCLPEFQGAVGARAHSEVGVTVES